MASVKGMREVGWFDCAGGGQVAIDGRTAYVAHMKFPHGTSVVDIADPRKPRLLATLEMPVGTHSHKVRVSNGVMLVNREKLTNEVDPDFVGGLGIYDVSNPAKPREITLWKTAGKGVHRFEFDGRYAYISPTVEGYISNILMILDLKDPARPQEVGRWWVPGQWRAGGEQPTWGDGVPPRCHHPLRLGNRLYTSYWHHGFYILDIENMAKPRLVSGMDWSPPYTHPTHTALPIPFPVRGRQLMVVTDEDVAKLWPSAPAFMWVVDITDEAHPVPISTFQLPEFDGSPQPAMTGCHQPCEKVTSTEIPVAWFARGLRVVDIADPHRPTEVAHFFPDPPPGSDRLSSNDVSVDDRGLLYLIDRVRGMHIVERVV